MGILDKGLKEGKPLRGFPSYFLKHGSDAEEMEIVAILPRYKIAVIYFQPLIDHAQTHRAVLIHPTQPSHHILTDNSLQPATHLHLIPWESTSLLGEITDIQGEKGFLVGTEGYSDVYGGPAGKKGEGTTWQCNGRSVEVEIGKPERYFRIYIGKKTDIYCPLAIPLASHSGSFMADVYSQGEILSEFLGNAVNEVGLLDIADLLLAIPVGEGASKVTWARGRGSEGEGIKLSILGGNCDRKRCLRLRKHGDARGVPKGTGCFIRYRGEGATHTQLPRHTNIEIDRLLTEGQHAYQHDYQQSKATQFQDIKPPLLGLYFAL